MYTLWCTSEVFLSFFFFRYRFRGTVDVFIYILQFFCSAIAENYNNVYMYNSARTCGGTWRRYTHRIDFLRTHPAYTHVPYTYIIKAHKIKNAPKRLRGYFPPPFTVGIAVWVKNAVTHLFTIPTYNIREPERRVNQLGVKDTRERQAK